MSLANENRKNRGKELNTAKNVDDTFVEPAVDAAIAKDTKNDSSSSPAYKSTNELTRDMQQSQQDSFNRILDESNRNIEKATEEAKSQIPKFTETVNSYQHQTLESAREIANNQINAQREIVNSLQNSWIPYWEKSYTLFWDFMSPQRMVEMYTNFMSSFADNAIIATRLANSSLLNTMETFKRSMEHAKQSSDDITTACAKFAKKMERDSRNMASTSRDSETLGKVESPSL